MTHPLVEEATRRSAVLWLRPEGEEGDHLVWHVWHDGAAWVVAGGGEQELPPMRRCLVVVRSKERQADRVVQWVADVVPVEPGSPAWEAGVPLLHAARQSPPDGEAQPERWARESMVLRLVPTGDTVPPGDGEDPVGLYPGRRTSPRATGTTCPVTR